MIPDVIWMGRLPLGHRSPYSMTPDQDSLPYQKSCTTPFGQEATWTLLNFQRLKGGPLLLATSLEGHPRIIIIMIFYAYLRLQS